MELKYLLKKNKITKYRLSEETGIPYSTICDICSEKTTLGNCKASTIYKLASYFEVTMEDFLYVDNRIPFEEFKSNIKHYVKDLGSQKFIIYVLRENLVNDYFDREWFPESLYVLAMLEYICRRDGLNLDVDFSYYQKQKLKEPIFPDGIIAMSCFENDETILEEAYKNAIPEFKKYNIIENEVENVA